MNEPSFMIYDNTQGVASLTLGYALIGLYLSASRR